MQRDHCRKIPPAFVFPFFLLIVLLAFCTQTVHAEKTAQEPSNQNGLAGTSWQLLSIQSMSDTQPSITIEKPEFYTLHFRNDGRAQMRLYCNRGMGNYQYTPTDTGESGQLSFGPIAMTRKLCPQPSLDGRISRDLDSVRSYLLRDGKLYISLKADDGIYEWQPLPQQP